MKNRIPALLIMIFAAIFVLSVSPAFAQDTDIDSMSNEELLLLLQSILQKLEGEGSAGGTAETAGSGSAAGPLAVSETETAPESSLFQVYENKKLIIEALPSYMFIRPEKKESHPEPDDPEDGNSPGGKEDPGQKEDPGGPEPCRVGEQCVPDDWYCRYELFPDGACRCMCG